MPLIALSVWAWQQGAAPAPFRLLAVLEVGRNPHQIAFSPDGGTAYVAASGSDRVARVEVATLRPRDEQKVADAPLGVAALAEGRIAVSRFRSDRVTRYGYGSQTADGHLVVGGSPSLLVGPVAGGAYLVSSEKTNRLWLLDLEEMRPLLSVETGRRPFPPAVTPDGRLAFVPNYDSGSVTVVDLRQRRVQATIPVGERPSGGAVLAGGGLYAVAVRGENRVALIDTARLEVVRSWETGIGQSPFSVVPTPDGRLAFVNNTASHDVSVVAMPEERVVARVAVGEIPIVMAVHPSGETLWVSSEGSHTLSVIRIPELGPGPLESVPVDVQRYRPSRGSREAEREMSETCEREVVQLHQFFEQWLTGRTERSEAVLDRLASALAEDFEIVSPSGTRSDRTRLLRTLGAAHGSHRSQGLRIWVENVRGRALADGLYLATYEEWQQVGEQAPRGRLSTAVFQRAPDAPGGVRWLHVHETWLGR